MISNFNIKYLDTLKRNILKASGISNLLPKDCRLISFSIMEQTKLAVSETTMKRFFGFATSRFHPSAFTLDALSIYCGYENWAAFCLAQPKTGPAEKNLLFIRKQAATGISKSMIDLINNPLILALMETHIPTLILWPDTPAFTILKYNEAYTNITYNIFKDIIGSTIWAAFNPQNTNGYARKLILDSLRDAIVKQKKVQITSLEYNPSSAMPSIMHPGFWDVLITPVMFDGNVEFLIMNITNSA